MTNCEARPQRPRRGWLKNRNQPGDFLKARRCGAPGACVDPAHTRKGRPETSRQSDNRTIPRFGPVRAALLIALLQTPHRFRTKRQLWAYCGLALETRISGEYRITKGQIERSKPGGGRFLDFLYLA